MKQIAKLGSAVAIAFAAGFGVAHLTAPVSAAAVPITPQYLDVVNMPVQKYVPIVTQDAMTLGVIPKGTPHGGAVIATGAMRLLVIKTPPQAPDDVHLLP